MGGVEGIIVLGQLPTISIMRPFINPECGEDNGNQGKKNEPEPILACAVINCEVCSINLSLETNDYYNQFYFYFISLSTSKGVA